mmetsp:Transcript_70036/g.146016  ORF Transcript_70036/g.146016 Transcript_70036/m.146016 type:complete len:217 (+) Transcript_70036:1539-2189(+)
MLREMSVCPKRRSHPAHTASEHTKLQSPTSVCVMVWNVKFLMTSGCVMNCDGRPQTTPFFFCLSESLGKPSGSVKGSPRKLRSSVSVGYIGSNVFPLILLPLNSTFCSSGVPLDLPRTNDAARLFGTFPGSWTSMGAGILPLGGGGRPPPPEAAAVGVLPVGTDGKSNNIESMSSEEGAGFAFCASFWYCSAFATMASARSPAQLASVSFPATSCR